jgi:aminopeptidase N
LANGIGLMICNSYLYKICSAFSPIKPLILFFCFMELISYAQIRDPHSYYIQGKNTVKHIHLSMDVRFATKSIHGTATIDLNTAVEGGELVLDTRDLQIKKITGANGQALIYELGNAHPIYGSALTIQLPPGVQQVVITYQTSPKAAALQWLNPEQTAGKKHPFLFTQGQAILSRSWFPCPDGPAFRFTYSAEVTVDRPLQVVMSARRIEADAKQNLKKQRFTFEMDKPVPAYLVAMGVGNLKFQTLHARCGVYAEPESLEKAAYEFANIGQMLETAEQLYGAYRWGRFDVLLLPPSFPFGGMENPMLTFATPTILAGDRSLTNLIAHELAHSWSGNLVTNATWNDFWLNEGFTVYFERRIMEAIEGKEFAEMLRVIGYQDLLATIESLADRPEDTQLKLSLQNRDPDDGVTDIAYEKGYFFLLTIESLVGRKAFDAFLNSYFDTFAFSTIATETFIQYLKENLFKDNDFLWEHLRAATWIYGPGLPSNCPIPKSKRFDLVKEAAEAFKTKKQLPTEAAAKWSTYEWQFFLRYIADVCTIADALALDKEFSLTATGNAEILFDWLNIGIRLKYDGINKRLEQFLTETGRRKFVAPLYKAMLADKHWAKEARRIYKKARPNYHSVTYHTIDAMMSGGNNAH